jgi:hypothetical protein
MGPVVLQGVRGSQLITTSIPRNVPSSAVQFIEVFKNECDGLWFGGVNKKMNGIIIAAKQPSKQTMEQIHQLGSILRSLQKKRPVTTPTSNNVQPSHSRLSYIIQPKQVFSQPRLPNTFGIHWSKPDIGAEPMGYKHPNPKELCEHLKVLTWYEQLSELDHKGP